MTTRKLTTFALGLACLSAAGARAEELTIASWGGSYQAAQRAALFEPFAKETGVRIVEDQHNGDIARVKAMVQANAVSWDVVNMYKFSVIQGCDDGILEVIDPALLGSKDDFIAGAIHRCGVASDIFANIVAYDANRAGANPPKALADFFDVDRFPGRRGLKRAPQGNLEFALLADGVAPDDVYKVLATREGQDRAFKMLDRIKPVAVWWQAGAQPPQLLADGEVVMTTAYNGRIANANSQEKRNFVIIWDGQVYEFDYWAMPKSGKNPALANRFLAFALEAKQQAAQTDFIPYGPPRKSAEPLVKQDVLPNLPTYKANLTHALAASPEFWADHFDAINKRFQSWLSQ